MSEQMRKEFEEALTKGMKGCKTSVVYSDYYTQLAWEAWQASRQSLVVKLPPKNNGKEFLSVEYCGNTFVKEQSFIDALDAVGVRYE